MKCVDVNFKIKTGLYKKLITKSRIEYINPSNLPPQFARPSRTIQAYMELGGYGVYTLLLYKNFFHVPKNSYGIKALAQYAKFHFYIKTIPSVASVHIQTHFETRSGSNRPVIWYFKTNS